MFLTDTALRRRPVVIILILLILVAGSYSYVTLPREAAPDVPIPYILVTTTYNGISPEDIENTVTSKIEKELAGLRGLKEIRSVSAEGRSVILVEFEPDIIIEDAMQYVRDRVDLAKPELPTDADEPFINEINIADFPIMLVSISGEVSPTRLKAITDRAEEEIERIPGVLNVDIMGLLEPEIRIEFDPDRLNIYDLTIPEVLNLIPAENVNISAGGLETEGTRFYVRIPAEFVEPEQINTLMIGMRNGNPIYLTDVASVRDTFKDRESYSRLDGVDSVTLAVQKRVGANIVETSELVKQAVKQLELEVPQGVRFDVTLDMSKYINQVVLDLENNIAAGLVLVVVVLVLFVGFRTSAIVALAIPMSMLMSFALIAALGLTLNMIVLFSLVLSLGMLVDNAIVIVENIYRHMQLGYKRLQAAHLGAAEVAWPVITSTATTVAAFSPLLFWPGIVGDFMSYLPITVICTLTSSLFVALVISPTVSSIFARAKNRKDLERKNFFVRWYRSLLDLTLEYRFATIAAAVALLLILVIIYIKNDLGLRFFPEADPDQARVDIRMPQGTNIRETDRVTRMVEQRIEKFRDDLDYVSTSVGLGAGGMTLDLRVSGAHNATITLIFRDYEDRERPSMEAIKEIRQALTDIPGAEITVQWEGMGPPTGAPVNVRIAGREFKELERLNNQAIQMIRTVPGLVNLRSDLELARPELVFTVDRQRSTMLGLDTATVGNFLKMAIFGRAVGSYREFNEEYDITIRLPEQHRTNIEDTLFLQVPNRDGDAIHLSSVGGFDYSGGYGTINRVDQRRVVTLSADAEGRLPQRVLEDVQRRLEELQLPAGYEITYAGEQEEQEESSQFLGRAFVMALLLIAMILVAQFNSLAVPLIIMATVVLSLVGVLSGLIVTQTPFGLVMTGIGVISLAGVVVNNAIVLLDYTRRLQRRGIELIEAAKQAGETRLRPVLLTAVTTILGLVPMATGVSYDFHKWEWATRSQSSEWWFSMAIAVIYGLAFATLLTLVVVPTLYVSVFRILQKFSLGGLETRQIDENGEGE